MMDDSASEFEKGHGLCLLAKLGNGKDGVVLHGGVHTLNRFLIPLVPAALNSFSDNNLHLARAAATGDRGSSGAFLSLCYQRMRV